ncbi:NAD-dependent epimerase/dehydratase family protein [Candidatus Laterigemmans baculatus]|uniref:NAD-dependent epimerase/dehydratase family protein n=1 Tax=Candidatus Laterigemmans baculatus TaxID=2770505 RepID=UPI0013D9A86B|nr:NAD-dependent epimerase/dehydratase family protein [Candidatus Laterigemmans baculatus]
MTLYDASSDTSPAAKSALIFGCGYLGIRVARKLICEGWRVAALTRSADRARALAAEGIDPQLGDWNDRRALSGLHATARTATHVLVSVGYDPRSKKSRHEVYVEGLRGALEVISPASRVCYVSSTGVFHQHDGRWVDECSPCHPASEGGAAHLRAEELLRRVRPPQSRAATVVLRMAGLYGPGRVPRLAMIRRGEPIATASEGFLNLIHIDDAAECVLRAWAHPAPAPLYLIADGHPVVRAEYYQEMARLSGSPPVRFTASTASSPTASSPTASSPTASSRGDSNKRIWTHRMQRDLLSRLAFPSYRHGLRAILGNEARRG